MNGMESESNKLNWKFIGETRRFDSCFFFSYDFYINKLEVSRISNEMYELNGRKSAFYESQFEQVMRVWRTERLYLGKNIVGLFIGMSIMFLSISGRL